jgi:hypothetical protein
MGEFIIKVEIDLASGRFLRNGGQGNFVMKRFTKIQNTKVVLGASIPASKIPEDDWDVDAAGRHVESLGCRVDDLQRKSEIL